MQDRIQALQNKYNQLVGQLQHIKKVRYSSRDERNVLSEQIVQYKAALEIVKELALRTQQNIEKELSAIVTYALNAIFEDKNKYNFLIKFVERRNKTEIDILLEKDGVEISPIDSTGGGLTDLLSLALQVSLWAIQTKRTRNTLILDEPLRFLKGSGYPTKGAELIKAISHKLKVQIIMVSHSSQLIHASDKVFAVTKDSKEVSHVKEIVTNGN